MGQIGERTKTTSVAAERAYTLVEGLQQGLVDALSEVSQQLGDGKGFLPVEWLRENGRHGGGVRFMAADQKLFNRASVNVSQIHYDDLPEKALGSATALSTIIHPKNPHAPSIHMHISWTEMKNGAGYWRIMADLNPSIPLESATLAFSACLKNATSDHYAEGSAQGDRYFNIPALARHRGVSHFYLENYHSEDSQADFELAKSVGEAVIQCYAQLMKEAVEHNPSPTSEDFQQQLAYHTLYMFQVLTLDRGTTSGLLVHNQNDIGILGSLPSHIDRELLASWKQRLDSPQDQLLEAILAPLPELSPCPIGDDIKQALADGIRRHYLDHPQALNMQARGDIIPPTVENHR